MRKPTPIEVMNASLDAIEKLVESINEDLRQKFEADASKVSFITIDRRDINEALKNNLDVVERFRKATKDAIEEVENREKQVSFFKRSAWAIANVGGLGFIIQLLHSLGQYWEIMT